MQNTKTIREGNVAFEAVVGIDRPALNRAVDVAAKHLKASYYRSMRDPISAACRGIRPWPQELTAENVASWIAANVSYSSPSDAHDILEAFAFESNR